MFLRFIEEVWKCFFKHKFCFTFFVALLLIFGIHEASHVGASTYPRESIASNGVVSLNFDSILTKNQADSIIYLYNCLSKRVVTAEEVVRNYQGDANLVIQKADERVGHWLTISTVLVTIIIGLSVWNNYKYETSLKDSIESVRCDLESTAQMNKIGSIMTCLNSLPDPLLTDSETDRKRYVKKNMSMLYDEFSKFVQISIDKKRNNIKDCEYSQLTLSLLKIAVLRAQGVFSDVTSNLSFYTFTTALDKEIKDFQCGKVTNRDLDERLKGILTQFEVFMNGLPDTI